MQKGNCVTTVPFCFRGGQRIVKSEITCHNKYNHGKIYTTAFDRFMREDGAAHERNASIKAIITVSFMYGRRPFLYGCAGSGR